MKPKLRRIESQLSERNGQPVALVHDSLGLTNRGIAVPLALIPLLELCDGTRDEATLCAALALRTGIQLDTLELQRILTQLDNALLLENDRSAAAYADALESFRAAPSRPPSMAGKAYPAYPDDLSRMLKGYLDLIPGEDDPAQAQLKGLICPHIDFARGGQVYAGIWQRAAGAARQAELAIILGTDHLDGGLLTLTRQHYSTPWGTLHTAIEVADAIGRAVGEEAAFRSELHHRNEHSIEAALVWLHYFIGERPFEVVPILCGSLRDFIEGTGDPTEDAAFMAAVDALKKATASRRTLVVAAADLAHVGPAFGDRLPLDVVERARLSVADKKLMDTMCRADARAFFQEIKMEGARRHICGLSPIFMALRLLEGAQGEVTGYAQCPADQAGASWVSICGVGFK